MNEKIKFINWNQSKLTKEISEIEFKSNIQNLNVSKDEQKRFWLTVFIPSTIAFVLFILLFIISSTIDNDIFKWSIRICTGLICGIFLATRLFKIFSFESIMSVLRPVQLTPQQEFHKSVFDKKIVDVELDGLYPYKNKFVQYPICLTLVDKSGNKSKYFFENESWTIYPSNKEVPFVDVDEMTIFCPLAEE